MTTEKEPTARQLAEHAVNLRNAGKGAAAETVMRFALAQAPKDPVVIANSGMVILTTPKAAEARELTKRAIALSPGLEPKLLHNMGLSSAYAGDIHAALMHLRKAEQTLDARFDLACFTLLSGDLAEGFRLMEVRRARDEHPVDYGIPEWDGREFDGCLWVEAEQGVGDIIQFARFLPWARSRCRRLAFSVAAPLMSLFYGYPGVDEVRLQEENVPRPEDAVFHTPLQSIAHFSGATRDTIPADLGHLLERSKDWPVTVTPNPRAEISVGLVWAGSPIHKRDAERSMPFEALMPVLEETRAQFFSLQAGPRGADPENAGVAVLIEDLRKELTTWLRTAAVIRSLDLVITVDTGVAHLAGALGVPCWVMVSKVPDWRWGLKTDRTPWYPRTRIFRQHKLWEWSGVVDDVRKALSREIENMAAATEKPAPVRTALAANG